MHVKIQFGRFKGKILRYPNEHQARPSLARARDVLFNWLYRCDRWRCLDLFAGTGILGLEALSLGATCVDFIDINQLHIKALKAHINAMNMVSVTTVHTCDAMEWVNNQSAPYDLIFLDPPFREGLLEKLLTHKKFKQLTHPNTLIYLEAERGWVPPEIWKITKQKNLADVSIYLVTPIFD